jgi:adenine-specific DNA methylase
MDLSSAIKPFPRTRYQGSKYKIADFIFNNIRDLKYDTVLDVFGGTGVMSYGFKKLGKKVIYNDILRSNYFIGKALIENDRFLLKDADIAEILNVKKKRPYPKFITHTFNGIYYRDKENEWLDRVIFNINDISNEYKKSLAFFALFQACLAKRPYNLFHRANLYMRTSRVERSFGNKTTWETPFPVLFKRFAKEANGAIFSNRKKNLSSNKDALKLTKKIDLIYIDPPYIARDGDGVEYIDYYHFLEGVADYKNWKKQIDYGSKNLRFKNEKSAWSDKKRISSVMEALIRKYKDSTIVISYHLNSVPSERQIVEMLKKYKRSNAVVEIRRSEYKYALSKKTSEALLFIAK